MEKNREAERVWEENSGWPELQQGSSTDCSVWGKVAGGLGAGVKGPALTLALVRVATGIACGPEHPLGPVCMVS